MNAISRASDIPQDYTDNQFQNDLLIFKELTVPSSYNLMPVVSERLPKYEIYHGQTQYQCYCKFINDVLRCVRKHQVDYCYFIYQIKELLKYEPDLQAKYLEELNCFKVWL